MGLIVAGCNALTGCIIPTELSAESQAVNLPPAIDVKMTQPPFGPITRNTTDIIEFAVVATDPNPADMLHARLFRLTKEGAALEYLGYFADGAPDSDKPPRIHFNFTALPCDVFNLQPTDPVIPPLTITVLVSDARFGDGAQTEGLTDQNSWFLKCN